MLSTAWSTALHRLAPGQLMENDVVPSPAFESPAATVQSLSSFGQLLDRAWNQVRASQQQADQMALAVASGRVQGPDLATAVNATQQASLLLSLVVTVRNRALEAYQEVMRMPV